MIDVAGGLQQPKAAVLAAARARCISLFQTTAQAQTDGLPVHVLDDAAAPHLAKDGVRCCCRRRRQVSLGALPLAKTHSSSTLLSYRYRQSSYHKQTKNHWARDDPAFVVATAGVVAALALVYGAIFAPSLARVFSLVLTSVLVDYLAVGAAIATACWLVANKLIHRRSPHPHSASGEQAVEWGYAFDVHCNAAFPLILGLGVSQLVLSPVLLLDSRLAAALSAALYSAAFVHYCYIIFLGYSALTFLERPETFLYPCLGLVVLLPLALLTGFNPTKVRRRRERILKRSCFPAVFLSLRAFTVFLTKF